jgi:hypothetical protein
MRNFVAKNMPQNRVHADRRRQQKYRLQMEDDEKGDCEVCGCWTGSLKEGLCQPCYVNRKEKERGSK